VDGLSRQSVDHSRNSAGGAKECKTKCKQRYVGVQEIQKKVRPSIISKKNPEAEQTKKGKRKSVLPLAYWGEIRDRLSIISEIFQRRSNLSSRNMAKTITNDVASSFLMICICRCVYACVCIYSNDRFRHRYRYMIYIYTHIHIYMHVRVYKYSCI